MIAFDVHYARNASLGLDLAILAKTIPVLLSQVRAARLPARSLERFRGTERSG